MRRVLGIALSLWLASALSCDSIALSQELDGETAAEEQEPPEQEPGVAVTIETGHVILHGELLERPYEVVVTNNECQINSRTLRIQDVLVLDEPEEDTVQDMGADDTPTPFQRDLTSAELTCHDVCMEKLDALLEEDEWTAELINECRQGILHTLASSDVVESTMTSGSIVATYKSGAVRRYRVPSGRNPELPDREDVLYQKALEKYESITFSLRNGALIYVLSTGAHGTVPASGGRVTSLLALLENACEEGDPEVICNRLGIPSDEALRFIENFEL